MAPVLLPIPMIGILAHPADSSTVRLHELREDAEVIKSPPSLVGTRPPRITALATKISGTGVFQMSEIGQLTSDLA